MPGKANLKWLLVVAVVVWLVLAIGFDVFVGWRVGKRRQSKSWPTTTATILASRLETHRSEDGATSEVKFEYGYEVAGRSYKATRWRFGTLPGDGPGSLAHFKPGSTRAVWYNPNDPAQCTLRPGWTQGDLGMILMSVPVNGFLLVAILAIVLSTGGSPLRVTGGGAVQKVRLSQCTPLGAFMVGWMSAAFMIALIAIISEKLTEAWLGKLLAAGPLVGVVFGVPTWLSHRSGSGHLIIDSPAGRVRVPRAGGRQRQTLVAFEDVIGVEMDRRTIMGRALYRPTLVVRSTGDEPRRMLLVEWDRQDRANALIDWLRQNLDLPATP